MGGHVGHKSKNHKAGNKSYGRARKAKAHCRMIDQIVLEDMLPENTVLLKNQPKDEYLPGLG